MSAVLTLNSSPEEVREAWAQAMESGEYLQGSGTMKRVFKDGTCRWCALGVLGDLFARAHLGDRADEAWAEPLKEGAMTPVTKVGDCVYLDDWGEVMKWAALATNQQLSVMDVNDGGASWGIVAQFVREL